MKMTLMYPETVQSVMFIPKKNHHIHKYDKRISRAFCSPNNKDIHANRPLGDKLYELIDSLKHNKFQGYDV